jgi:hypothetical protein
MISADVELMAMWLVSEQLKPLGFLLPVFLRVSF